MKQRTTTPVSKSFTVKAISVAVAVMMCMTSVMTATPVKADDYETRIANLQKEIDAFNGEAARRKTQADTLQNQLTILAGQKATIVQKINLLNENLESLKKEIVTTEKRIDETKTTLGTTIADIYVSDSITPIEMIASSSNIGEYVDEQEYRSTIRDNLKQKIDEIKVLRAKLEEQKKGVERTIADQNNAKMALEATEREQSNLLAQTKNDEAAYQRLAGEKQSEQSKVKQAQQAAIEEAIRAAARRNGGSGGPLNVSGGDGSRGGYPWGNCYVDANAMSYGEDPLGYGCRQCVSYAAWKMYQKTGYSPYYWGNANMWPGSARRAGFSTGSTPKAGSLGVMSAGQYGHIVYVEGVNGDGTVRISQYNYYNAGGPGWGNYSEMTVPSWTYDTYIYIQ